MSEILNIITPGDRLSWRTSRGFEDDVKTNGAQSWFAKIQDVGYGGGLDLQRGKDYQRWLK